MKTNTSSDLSFTFRDAMTRDAMRGSGDAMRLILAAIGHTPQASAYRWPGVGALDADLRRAVAFRHGCLFVDDTFLVGSNGQVDLDRCEQTHDFVCETIDSCLAERGVRATKSMREYVTRAVMQYMVRKALTMFNGARLIRRAAADFSSLGVDVSIPGDALRDPQNATESAVAAAAVALVQESCDTADSAVLSSAAAEAVRAQPQKTDRAAKTNVSHLRLVK